MYDIALMRIDQPLKFSEAIKPIQLVKNEVPTNSNITIAGWGKVSTWGGIPDRLKFNTLKAISQKDCARTSGIDFEGLICLGHPENNGACNVS